MIIKLTAALITTLILVAIPGLIYGVVELVQYFPASPFQVFTFIIGIALLPFAWQVTKLIYQIVMGNLLDCEARHFWKKKL
jgi:hypothetical protein